MISLYQIFIIYSIFCLILGFRLSNRLILTKDKNINVGNHFAVPAFLSLVICLFSIAISRFILEITRNSSLFEAFFMFKSSYYQFLNFTHMSHEKHIFILLTFIITLLLGFFSHLVMNYPIKKSKGLEHQLLTHLYKRDHIVATLYKCYTDNMMCMINLSNGKAYVGKVNDNIYNYGVDENYITIDPIASGQRNEKGVLKFNVDYLKMKRKDDPINNNNPYKITISRKDIISVNTFFPPVTPTLKNDENIIKKLIKRIKNKEDDNDIHNEIIMSMIEETRKNLPYVKNIDYNSKRFFNMSLLMSYKLFPYTAFSTFISYTEETFYLTGIFAMITGGLYIRSTHP